jgi:hypothetical protein
LTTLDIAKLVRSEMHAAQLLAASQRRIDRDVIRIEQAQRYSGGG